MWWRDPSNCLCPGIVLGVLCTHSDCGHLVTEGHSRSLLTSFIYWNIFLLIPGVTRSNCEAWTTVQLLSLITSPPHLLSIVTAQIVRSWNKWNQSIMTPLCLKHEASVTIWKMLILFKADEEIIINVWRKKILAFIYICFRSKVQTGKKELHTNKVYYNKWSLFQRISTARIRHPDQQARIFIFKPCIMEPFQPRRPLCIRVQKYCFAML